jgi:hypothetical protein
MSDRLKAAYGSLDSRRGKTTWGAPLTRPFASGGATPSRLSVSRKVNVGAGTSSPLRYASYSSPRPSKSDACPGTGRNPVVVAAESAPAQPGALAENDLLGEQLRVGVVRHEVDLVL